MEGGLYDEGDRRTRKGRRERGVEGMCEREYIVRLWTQNKKGTQTERSRGRTGGRERTKIHVGEASVGREEGQTNK